MNNEVIVSCPVTGGADAAHLHPDLPITPKQIADAAIQAAKAGAAIAHCHVRDPETGKGVRDVALYREVVERIRRSELGWHLLAHQTEHSQGDHVELVPWGDMVEVVNALERAKRYQRQAEDGHTQLQESDDLELRKEKNGMASTRKRGRESKADASPPL